MRILIVQHGEKIREPGDPGLTSTGREQAQATAALLALLETPVAVISSPMCRAVETASPIAEAFGIRPDRPSAARANELERELIAVMHGGVTVDLLRTLLGDAEIERRAPAVISHGVPSCAITELEHAGERWTAIRIADQTHLEGL